MNKFNFLYIKTPKTASELIKRYLRLYGDAAELTRNSNSLGEYFKKDFFEYSCEHIMMSPKVLKHFFTRNNKVVSVDSTGDFRTITDGFRYIPTDILMGYFIEKAKIYIERILPYEYPNDSR